LRTFSLHVLVILVFFFMRGFPFFPGGILYF
jgi:hypothetical protein